MPKVDPMQYLMTAISSLTGGLITDLQTLFLGVIVCMFIWFGIDHLMFALETFTQNRSKDLAFSRAQKSLSNRAGFARGSAEYDRETARYRKYINKSV